MKLLLKFNLILILVFRPGVTLAGYLSRQLLERSARNQVLEQARLMIRAAGGMRTYTSEQVGPLLTAHQERIKAFLPQVVPSTWPSKCSTICTPPILTILTRAPRKPR